MTTGSAPMDARQRRRRRAMHDMARAAVELFAEQGFDATPVEQIAEASDYSASTFFRAFARKEDCVFFDLPERLDIASDSVVAATKLGDWKALRASLLQHARSWEGGDPEFARTRARLFHREPALIARYLEHCYRWENDLAARILGSTSRKLDHAAVYLTAGIVVTAYRTAFRLQVESGGALDDLLDDALRRVEASGVIRDLFAEA